jgi:DinB superfamily
MRKQAGGKTSGRSRRARQPKSTSARSSSSKKAEKKRHDAERAETAEKTNAALALRQHLVNALAWQDAHAGFERALEGLPADARGRRPPGLPYSPWQLLEHLRLSQHDILDFCRNPKYVELTWPADYWPKGDAPPDAAAWEASIEAFKRDRRAMQQIATDLRVDLFARIPHGSGQTYLRELLLVLDHNAYHIGELVAARRMLGTWNPA